MLKSENLNWNLDFRTPKPLRSRLLNDNLYLLMVIAPLLNQISIKGENRGALFTFLKSFRYLDAPCPRGISHRGCGFTKNIAPALAIKRLSSV